MNFSEGYIASLESARVAREDLIRFAVSCGFGKPDLRDIEIAVGEAVANAIEHGNKMTGEFRITASFSDDVLVVEIADGGAGFASSKEPPSNPFRGWGIQLMRQLVDNITFHDNGSRVRLKKRLVKQNDASNATSGRPLGAD